MTDLSQIVRKVCKQKSYKNPSKIDKVIELA